MGINDLSNLVKFVWDFFLIFMMIYIMIRIITITISSKVTKNKNSKTTMKEILNLIDEIEKLDKNKKDK